MSLGRDEKVSLNDVDFPKFSPEQTEFFLAMKRQTETQRLNLDMEDPLFKYQAVSLEAIENQFQWLADGTEAVLSAERKERIFSDKYDPEEELQELSNQDDLSLEDIETLL